MICKWAVGTPPECGKTICCYDCDEKCSDRCDEDIRHCLYLEKQEELIAFSKDEQTLALIQNFRELEILKKKVKDSEEKLKDSLKESMEKFGVKNFKNDFVSFTYVPENEYSSLDSTVLKKRYPEIAKECTVVKKRKSYVKVTVK